MEVNEQALKYEMVFGFNTKQWWVYNNDLDVYIDVPSEVLDEVKSVEFEKQQDKLAEIVMTLPSWLNDTEYYYNGETDI